MDDTGDARGNGLMDLEGRGITVMRRAGRVGLTMVPLGGLAISMRDVVCVRVHCSSTRANYRDRPESAQARLSRRTDYKNQDGATDVRRHFGDAEANHVIVRARS